MTAARDSRVESTRQDATGVAGSGNPSSDPTGVNALGVPSPSSVGLGQLRAESPGQPSEGDIARAEQQPGEPRATGTATAMTFEVARDFVIDGLVAASDEMSRTGVFVIPDGFREPAITTLRLIAADPQRMGDYFRRFEKKVEGKQWISSPFGDDVAAQAFDDDCIRDGLSILTDQELVAVLICPSAVSTLATVMREHWDHGEAGPYWSEAIEKDGPAVFPHHAQMLALVLGPDGVRSMREKLLQYLKSEKA